MVKKISTIANFVLNLHRDQAIGTMKLIFVTIVLLAFAIILLGVKVLFVKGGKFPSGHAHDIPALRRKGIGCAHSPESH